MTTEPTLSPAAEALQSLFQRSTMLITLLLGCASNKALPEGDELDLPIEDSATADTATPEPSDTPEPSEPAEPATEPAAEPDVEPAAEPDGTQVCYPGADWSYTACYDLVDADPSWGSDYEYPAPYQGNPQYTAPLRFIDLDTVTLSDSLAPNFVLSELMHPAKGRYSLFQVHMVETLQTLREQSGGPLNINSGYRNPAYNAGVGGVEHSRHIFGDAADMYSSVLSLAALGELCEQLDAGYVGLYETHVHCDWRNEELDPAFWDPSIGNSLRQATLEHATPELRALPNGLLWTTKEGFDEGEPLRTWQSYSPDDQLLETHTGPSYLPPQRAVRVKVNIGGQSELERLIDR